MAIPEHLERLLSERLDGALSSAETAERARAEAADQHAAQLARRYERLAHRLAPWRALPADVDFQALGRRIREGIAVGGAGAESAAVNDLLRDWAQPMPPVDWNRLHRRVVHAIRAEARRSRLGSPRSALSWAVRIAVPLAAAAAIVMAVWRPWTRSPSEMAKVPAARPEVVVSVQTPSSGGQVRITLQETPARRIESARGGEKRSAIAVAPKSKDSPADLADMLVLY